MILNTNLLKKERLEDEMTILGHFFGGGHYLACQCRQMLLKGAREGFQASLNFFPHAFFPASGSVNVHIQLAMELDGIRQRL